MGSTADTALLLVEITDRKWSCLIRKSLDRVQSTELLLRSWKSFGLCKCKVALLSIGYYLDRFLDTDANSSRFLVKKPFNV